MQPETEIYQSILIYFSKRYPKRVPQLLIVKCKKDTDVTLSMPDQLEEGPKETPEDWFPNAVQAEILQLLEERPMRSTELGDRIGDRSRLYRKPGGIQELMEKGLVKYNSRIGYYRPECLENGEEE